MKKTIVFKKKSYKHTMHYSVDNENYEMTTERDVPITTLRRKFMSAIGGEPNEWSLVSTETVLEKWEMPLEEFKANASYSSNVEEN